MCSTFAKAVDRIPFLQRQLCFWICPPPDEDFHPCLGSPLLLKWARHLQQLSLRRWDYGLPGMADFLAAAARIKTIHMRCEDLLEAARADSLLASTKAVTKLTAEGPVLPSPYPPTVTELRLNIGQYCCTDEDETGEVWDSMLVDSLLFRASQLAQLHTLSVALTALSIKDIQFTCPVHLLGLQHLSIEFWISDDTVIDLGWVHRQACPRLDLQIWVQTSDFEVHAAVVQQLGQLTVSSLEMEVRVDFPAALQILWASLAIAKSSWYFRYECTFSQASGALQALPPGQASCVLRFWNAHASKPCTFPGRP